MSVAAVRTPTEFESRLARYLYERSEEGRAVRVGEKEFSEQTEIVKRYADLFSVEQLEALRDAEDRAEGDERELLYRLRKTCEGGLVSAVLVEREDEGRCTGRTRGGQLVHFDGHKRLIGRLVDVEIVEATPWSLQARQANALLVL